MDEEEVSALRPLTVVGDDCVELPLSSLLPADSPRLAGVSEQHSQLLAESDSELPPIVVHRTTMRVIDGMHRVRAALLRGEETITARLFDGTDEAAFVEAVEANVRHGLPLSLSDREAATARIIASHPLWSDRRIASISGISAKTVRAIRCAEDSDRYQPSARIGRDGRVRPVNGTAGRQRACELFRMWPNASLREVAREAGISPGTARDVRIRMKQGEDPVRPRQHPTNARRGPVTPERQLRRRLSFGRSAAPRDRETTLQNLHHDPAVRFTESGRMLLRWLDTHALGVDGWSEVVPTIPPHCAYVIADLACAIADEWLQVAESARRSVDVTSEPDRPPVAHMTSLGRAEG
ncbi:MAG TPA: ParB/RepB/Spo0J family partition protein [Jatrophihabitans sp.]|nr:ParB/RepB/Spo0J family partition protein [Jatrophihabitans sp.]